ncbi:MAG: amino acid permease [Pirellulaceae bacterium]|jgi:ethanolamine permease|nr:amino acid permease [Pirellulaceae bacterium]
MNKNDQKPGGELKKSLGPVMLWGLGVGYVISGEYFGWNLGLAEGGAYGMLFAFVLITLMYVAFVFSYAELACAIPRAGGVFVYGIRALGPFWGYIGGVAQVVEFVFAPPAIAMAIGAYAGTWLGDVDPRVSAAAAFVLFTLLNLWGVRQAATFELVITVLAVGELLLFTGVVAPHFRVENFTANAWPNGWTGAFAAVPFAIWFYLAIEGVANAAEEAKHPQRDVAIGFGAAMLTLVALAICVFFVGVGVGGWERIVYSPDQLTGSGGAIVVADGAEPQDSPLPLALGQLFAVDHPLYHMLVGIGALGLIASLNGIILIAGRALFEMGRVGFLPRILGSTNRRTQTPACALVLNMIIGVFAITVLPTGKLITMSAMGAVTLYIVSMIALMRLRKTEPLLQRPYRTPWYPVLPIVALAIAIIALACMIWENLNNVGDLSKIQNLASSISLWYLLFLVVASGYYQFVLKSRLKSMEWDQLAKTEAGGDTEKKDV